MTTVRDRAARRPCATARRDDRAAVGWAWTGRNLILDEALCAMASESSGNDFEGVLQDDKCCISQF